MDFEPVVIGAALPVQALAQHRDWLLGAPRDVELQSFHSHENLSGDWSAAVAEAKRQLDGHTGRLGIHGPFWGFTIHSQDPDIRAVVARRMMQALDVCAALGATQMVIHSPYSTWDDFNLDGYPSAREMVIENTRATLAEVVARAMDDGVELVMENIADRNPHDRRILAEALGDGVQLSVDTGHANWAHHATGAPPVDYFIRLAGARLAHVHLQDTDGHADRHWAIGEGNIAWTAVFREIAALGGVPRPVLELRDHTRIPASFAYLRGLGLVR
ncbi:MAG: sugar phosphate isomerase/epimerase family protein [Pseudomonadota bacterium]